MSDTASVTFSQPLAAGNAVLVATYTQGGMPATVSDTQGNTYSMHVGPVIYATYNGSMYLFVALHVAGGDDTVTVRCDRRGRRARLYARAHQRGRASTPCMASRESGTTRPMAWRAEPWLRAARAI